MQVNWVTNTISC